MNITEYYLVVLLCYTFAFFHFPHCYVMVNKVVYRKATGCYYASTMTF